MASRSLADVFRMLQEVADRGACVNQHELIRHLAGLFVDTCPGLEQTALGLFKLSSNELPLVGTDSLESSKCSIEEQPHHSAP